MEVDVENYHFLSVERLCICVGLGNRKHEEESQSLDAESRTPLKFLHYGRACKTVVNVSPRGTFGGLSLDDPEIILEYWKEQGGAHPLSLLRGDLYATSCLCGGRGASPLNEAGTEPRWIPK